MMTRQIKKSAIVSALPLLALGAMMIPGTACDDSNPLCCSSDNFQVGAKLDGSIGGGAKAQVAVQAVADFAGVASVMLEDLTAACRNIAMDLGVTSAAAEESLDGKTSKQDVAKNWCTLAVAKIGEFKAGAQLSINFDAPKCSVSASASLDCQAGCTVDAECDVKATPPTCEGGKLEVACSGSCTAKAGASLSCEVGCSGECSGACEASGGVACSGKCEGTCKGEAQGGTGEGLKADGTCAGTCEGKCEVTAPGATCSGSCKGECKGGCTGSAEASVKCDGECTGTVEPLKCEGGELKASCEVDAECGASCSASASAKAECTPPSISVSFSGSASGDAALKLAKLKATLQANFGVIAVAKTKLTAMGEFGGTLAGNIEGVLDIKPACILVVVNSLKDAVGDVRASTELTVSLMGSVGK